MRDVIQSNRKRVNELFNLIQASDGSGAEIGLEEATEKAINSILEHSQLGGKVILIGNGGSAAIASHMAIDFWKTTSIKAVSFNDGALLTCIGNDLGYENVFAKPIEMFAEDDDLVIAISSSGQSPNILNGVRAAKDQGLRIFTLSGFKEDNPLRSMGDLNFYVPASHYGHVECLHHFICHSFIDVINDMKVELTERAIIHE